MLVDDGNDSAEPPRSLTGVSGGGTGSNVEGSLTAWRTPAF